jgi:hypothetical protein
MSSACLQKFDGPNTVAALLSEEAQQLEDLGLARGMKVPAPGALYDKARQWCSFLTPVRDRR